MMSAEMAPPDLLKITVFWNKGSVVKISFDEVVGHLFTDSISLVNHKEPAWLVLNGEILKIWPVQITRNRYLRLLQKIFLSSVAASNWWLGTWVHGKMCTKDISPLRCSSLQQELKFLCLQCSWNLVWNNWMGHMFEAVTMQLTCTGLIAPDVLLRRNSKFSLVF